jgi:hypothetical protein
VVTGSVKVSFADSVKYIKKESCDTIPAEKYDSCSLKTYEVAQFSIKRDIKRFLFIFLGESE